MFNVLKLSALVLLKSYKITDEKSCRIFLRELILLIKSHVTATKSQVDDAILNYIEFIVNNNVLFEYVYRLILEQFQTPEILFESVSEDTIIELVESGASENTELLETINPVVIYALISQIISVINTLKNK